MVEEQRFASLGKKGVHLVHRFPTLAEQIEHQESRISPECFQHELIHLAVPGEAHSEGCVLRIMGVPCYGSGGHSVHIGVADNVKYGLHSHPPSLVSSFSHPKYSSPRIFQEEREGERQKRRHRGEK
jgi:hypothetical protein